MSWLKNVSLRIVVAGLGLATCGCDDISSPTLGSSVRYTPPLTPVSIVWNTDGEITIDGNHQRLVTPIGVFEFGSSARWSAAPDKMVVVVEDVTTRQSSVFEVDDRLELSLDGTAKIRFEQHRHRVILQIEHGQTGQIRLLPTTISPSNGSPVSSSVGGTSSTPNGGSELCGAWTTPQGDALGLSAVGSDQIAVTLIQGQKMLACEGELRFDGLVWKGTVEVIFAADRTHQRRPAPFAIQVISESHLMVRTDYISWDAWGRESKREPAVISLRRR